MTLSAAPGDGAVPVKPQSEGLLVAPRRPVTRYRPILIALAGALVGGVAAAALVIGLAPSKHVAPDVGPRAEGAGAATPLEASLGDGHADYADPQGPLGAAAAEVSMPAAPSIPPSAAEAAQSGETAAAGEAEAAARSAPLFGGVSVRTPLETAERPSSGPADAIPPASSALDGAKPPGSLTAGPQTPQTQKAAFIEAARASASAARYQAPQSPFEVKAGAVISAALVTALNSDLPGEAIAQVTQNVYDTATGRCLLIPQGARLIGRYDSQLVYGQGRALMVWTRIVMPDGRSVDLGGMTGADLSGAAGLTDRVDDHIGPITRAIALSTAITVGGAVAQNAGARAGGGLVLNDAASGVSAQAAQVGQRFVDRDLNRQPTVQIRPGWPLSVIVSKDLSLAPY